MCEKIELNRFRRIILKWMHARHLLVSETNQKRIKITEKDNGKVALSVNFRYLLNFSLNVECIDVSATDFI